MESVSGRRLTAASEMSRLEVEGARPAATNTKAGRRDLRRFATKPYRHSHRAARCGVFGAEGRYGVSFGVRRFCAQYQARMPVDGAVARLEAEKKVVCAIG